MVKRRLRKEIERLAVHYRRLRLRTTLSLTWSLCAAAGAGALWLNISVGWHSPWTAPVLAAVASAAALLCFRLSSGSCRDEHWIARQVEAEYPELEARLLTAIEQEPRSADGRLGFLQETLIREVLSHARRRPWRKTLPQRRLRLAGLANVVSFSLAAVVLVALFFEAGPRRQPLSRPDGTSPGARYRVTVEPGDTELERGSSLFVAARFDGAAPEDATLVYEGALGQPTSLRMSRSLDDPLFGGRVPAVDEDLSYRVEFAGQRTRSYRVTVFEYPELLRADAKLVFPRYTALEETVVEDTRRVTAVEGTKLTLDCQLNKPVAEAQLVDEEGDVVHLSPVDASGQGGETALYGASMTLERSRRYKLLLVDLQGRENREPAEFAINVLPNRRPDLKLVFPSRDMRVSPLEELTVKASLWDDFGLLRYGFAYGLPGGRSDDLTLGESAPGKERREVEHLLDFEALGAQPDQLVSYYFWVEDADPEGGPRRTFSDMYFAEVRHFEEIFRQGQQPPGGSSQGRQPGEQRGGGNARDAAGLAELQKRIINGTWNLIRRETKKEPSPKFAEDVTLLKESQESALERAGSLGARLRDEASKARADAVTEHMTRAVEKLTAAADGPSADDLRPAMAAEQAALEALLKLRARDQSVVRGRSQGQSSGSSSGRSQQQLRQLELTSSENRYETQRTSQAPQSQEQRELRQALDRLRELARRQEDLNRRLKELQSALEEARTEEERQELSRQLKRLRDEEQRILRDTDELRNRMDRPANQERMAEARRELDRTRSNVRRASEALKEGLVSRAAAAGTRAARQFQELRDEFRRKAAGRFSEEMREMRNDARRLDEREQELARRLGEIHKDRAGEKSLRRPSERQRIQRGLDGQRRDLDSLLDRMKETVEQAEESEPLLSRELYNTLREARQRKLDSALELTRRLVERGFVRQAGQEEERARQGIGALRRGIERAAESVLGDETEALRRAERELEELENQLNDEIARATSRAQRGEPREQRGGGRNGRTGERASRRGGERPESERRTAESASRPGGERPESERRSEERPSPSSGERGETERGETERRGGSASGAPGPDRSRQEGRPGDPRRLRGGTRSAARERGGLERFFEGGSRPVAPIAGEGFREWSDRLRDVEEMMDDPELRSEAARIRDRARGARAEFKRDFKEPDWEMVRLSIAEPLAELRRRVAEELLKRQAKDALVPIDRDPVPPKYSEQVRRYYERIGSGK